MPLPPGLTLNRDTGVISGVPTSAGTYNYSLVVRDLQGAVRVIPVSQLINPYDPPVINGTPGQYATRTVPYSFVPSVTAGIGPFTWSLASGALPTGLSLNTITGAITGTPTDTTYTDRALSLRVTDTPGSVVQLTWTLHYRNALTSAYAYPSGIQNTAYAATPTYAGGHTPLTWALTSGTLPSGLSFNTSTGGISGTPTGVSTTAISVTGTDAAGNVITIAQNLQILASYVPVAISGSMTGTSKTYQRAAGTEVIAPASTLAASGGTGTITYSWVRLSGSTKVSAAAPTSINTGFNCTAAAGENVSAAFRLTATDGTSSDTYDVTITGNNTYVFPVLSGSPPVRATFNKPYTGSFTLTGGKAPISYALVSGTLPTGITLNTSTGVISGTPSDTTYTDRAITIRVTDAEGQTNDRSYTMQYRAAVTMGGTPGPGYTTQAYSFVPTISGGHVPYAVTLIAGALPTGTTLNGSTGAVTGTVTTAGTYNYTLRTTDADGNIGDKAYTTTVNAYTVPSLSGSLTNHATRGEAYSSSLTRSNGLAPFVYSTASGTYPIGIVLDTATGLVSGTPSSTSYATYVPAIRVTDALGNVATSAAQSISYRDRPTMVGRAFTPRTRTQAISESVATAATPIHTPIAYAIVSGSLPTGASLNASTGAITGTLTGTSYGTYSADIRATDTYGATSTATYTLAYANALTVANSGTPLEAEVGWGWASWSHASGGFTPYTYSVISGALPAGATLNTNTGDISGNPTTVQSGSYAIRATDAQGNTGDGASVSYTIYAQLTKTAQWAGGTLQIGVSIGTQQSITTTGGKTPLSYAVVSGALPAGISLNTGTGALTGTPTTAGAYSFVVRVTDFFAANVQTTTISGTVIAAVNVIPDSWGELAGDIDPPTASRSGVSFSTSGTESRLAGAGTSSLGTWLLSGASADYEIMAVLTLENPPGCALGSAYSTWISADLSPSWYAQRARFDIGLDHIAFTVSIRDKATHTTLDSGSFDYTSERN